MAAVNVQAEIGVDADAVKSLMELIAKISAISTGDDARSQEVAALAEAAGKIVVNNLRVVFK